MKRILSVLILILSAVLVEAQSSSAQFESFDEIQIQNDRPKLVVGIVVDQMRYDYLTRFANKYGDGGFMRLIKDGFNCKNNHFNYIPTYTGPGHASIYSGTTPRNHGIISNSWYDKENKEFVYCTQDDTVMPVGSFSPSNRNSPRRMVSSTLSDEIKLFTQQRGKAIGISIKDRGAVLPAGHSADAAYWFEGGILGNWVSSSYYMEELPTWVSQFNDSDVVRSYLKTWSTLYDINSYTESGSDLNNYEGGFRGKETATFPYDLEKLALTNGNLDILKSSPYGNSITTDFAIAALKGENLGKDDDTDILAISYSSTDYIGHNFGVNSKEVQDTYIRLDKDIERLLNTLDQELGKGQYTVFLTSDHGAVNVPAYLKDQGIPAGYVENDSLKARFSEFIVRKFTNRDLVENVSNNQVFINRDILEQLNLDLIEVQESLVEELVTYGHIDKAFTAESIHNGDFLDGIEQQLKNGYNQKRSGDVLIVNKPAFISYSQTGSTHGTGQNYDTHVPLIFYGKGIKQGQTVKYTSIPDIAPTISALLQISFPSAATGKPLSFVLD